ncbi:MAG TPA: MFS transporter [Dehalococcoidia bacterium]|nr:MFS transporter [Dehalococcoidia bacterium]
MTEPDLETPEKHDPLAALRQRNFQLYSGSRIFSTLAQQMLQAVLAWQIYDITHSPLSIGFLGLARFFPALSMSMIGGTAADTYDRRKIMLLAQTVPLACAVILGIATSGDWVSEGLIYGLVVLIGLASAFEAPARTAFLPAIVTPATFANAVTVNNIFQKLGSVSGPTVAGALIAGVGITSVYVAFVSCMFISVVPLVILKYQRAPSSGQRLSSKAIKEGVAFVIKNQVLLGAMSLDMFAVIFGGAAALLPIYATDILNGGPTAFGLLTSSLQVGAFLMSFVLVAIPPVRRTGRALVYTVIAFGLFTIVFGLSRNLYLSLFFYGLIGAADQISVVMRQTTIQMATPDELRGRVSSVHQVFVQASSQIGGMESAFVAALATATFSVVTGGLAAVAIAAAIGWRMPLLYRHEVSAFGGSRAPASPPANGDTREQRREEPATASGGS